MRMRSYDADRENNVPVLIPLAPHVLVLFKALAMLPAVAVVVQLGLLLTRPRVLPLGSYAAWVAAAVYCGLAILVPFLPQGLFCTASEGAST